MPIGVIVCPPGRHCIRDRIAALRMPRLPRLAALFDEAWGAIHIIPAAPCPPSVRPGRDYASSV